MAQRISEQVIEWLKVGNNHFASQTNYPLYVDGNSYLNGDITHNGVAYFANGTIYKIDNSGNAKLNSLFVTSEVNINDEWTIDANEGIGNYTLGDYFIYLDTNNNLTAYFDKLRIGSNWTYGSATQPIWYNNGIPEVITYSLNATINAGTATQAAYYSNTNTIASTPILTIGSSYINITANSNTVQIGSQNTSFLHIYNSANIPFIFNNSVLTTTGNLGNATYPFNNLYIGKGNGNGIYHVGTQSTYQMIRFIDNTTDTYGNGIAIGGGGQTIIGGGESATVLAGQAGTAGAEIMQIGNDGDVQIFSNLQNGYSTNNYKLLTWSTSGRLTAQNWDTSQETGLAAYNGTNGYDVRLIVNNTATPDVGIYSTKHGNWLVRETKDGYTYYLDGYNKTPTRLAYSQSGLAHSAITWLTCWNGYELRAISKDYFPIQIGSIGGSSSTTYASAYQTYFNSNKASIPRNKLISWYSSSYSNGAVGFGYQLTGYDSTPYGGFFVAHYDIAHYVGVSNGTFNEHRLIFGKRDGYYGTAAPSGTYSAGDVYFQYVN